MKLPSILFAALVPACFGVGQSTGPDPIGGEIIKEPSNLPGDLNGFNFTYGLPINLFRFTSQLQDLDMAFLDVPPSSSPSTSYPTPRSKQSTGDAPVAVLLHGKNFCSITWNGTIDALSEAGYRVIAPDQIGFCKSTKPENYQFSLSQLAYNTYSLLQALDIPKATIIGHSMGGMLAARFALQYPKVIDKLVMVNAIGLEDYIAKGVPWPSFEASYAQERSQTYESIRGYQQQVYYPGEEWRPEYDVWVRMSASIYAGSQAEIFARNQAKVVDMVLTQPIAHEFENIKAETALMIGERDTTAIGKPTAPEEVQENLGRYDLLGEEVAGRIPNAHLIAFPELGHSPQIQDPDSFHSELLAWLD